MDTIIIGQGYNLDEDTSVGKELIELFNSKRYDSFTCLVAFASYGAISALTPYILKEKERGVKIKVILGIDQKGTSKEALEEVLSWGVDSKIYHTETVNIFHPKIYLFENTDIFTMIVGSNNLTEMGLVKNIECSLLIKDIRSNPVHAEFYRYWKSILDGSELNLYTITQDLIDKLYVDKVIPSESQRSNSYDNGLDTTAVHTAKSVKFRSVKIQHNPAGFIPKRLIKAKKIQADKNNISTQTVKEISYPVADNVLLAEIGGGKRWKQVNFPIKIFENFFGAHKGDNNYTVKLTNIAQDGTLGETRDQQAVTVKSNNFRFELNCVETQGQYPGNENRPIGIFIKTGERNFLYQVLLSSYPAYKKIKDYLYLESSAGRIGELKRKVIHIEALHALYPELII